MAFLQRAQQMATVLRTFMARGSGETLHLFALLESVRSAGLPPVNLSEVMSLLGSAGRDTPPVTIHPLLRGAGSGSASEMAALAAVTALTRPKTILEFGTFEGASTWHLLANADPSCTITTLDLPADTRVQGSSDVGLQGAAGKRPFLPRDPRIRVLEVDSRQWTPDVSQVDLCFIDAGHSYECVKNDTEKALRVMRPGGVILWHDAAWRRDSYDVNGYLRELRSTGHDVRLLRIGPFDYCALALLRTRGEDR